MKKNVGVGLGLFASIGGLIALIPAFLIIIALTYFYGRIGAIIGFFVVIVYLIFVTILIAAWVSKRLRQ